GLKLVSGRPRDVTGSASVTGRQEMGVYFHRFVLRGHPHYAFSQYSRKNIKCDSSVKAWHEDDNRTLIPLLCTGCPPLICGLSIDRHIQNDKIVAVTPTSCATG